MFSSSIGYSGVLFAYAAMEAFHSTQTSRSVFGIFSVPTKAYPFIMLIVLQVSRMLVLVLFRVVLSSCLFRLYYPISVYSKPSYL